MHDIGLTKILYIKKKILITKHRNLPKRYRHEFTYRKLRGIPDRAIVTPCPRYVSNYPYNRKWRQRYTYQVLC